MIRRHITCLLAMLLLLPTISAQAAKVVNIGIVTDGPIEHISWSPELFKNELLLLTEADFDVRFPPAKTIDGRWSAERIAAAHKQLQQDPAVDMVLALGYVSSAVAAMTSPLHKPTFAPFVMDADLQGLPKSGNTSGVKNLNYLSAGANFVRDLEVFNGIANCRRIAVFVDEANYDAQPGLIRRAREVTTAADVELLFIQQRTRNEDLAVRLPQSVDCVVVTDLPRLDSVTMDRLIAALIERRLPSYSLLDSQLVERGLLMAEAPASDWQRLARRNALNMHAVVHGESAEDQPVVFVSKRRLTINMATARAIGISPRYDIMNTALLLNEEQPPRGRQLSLAMVATEAVKANLDLRAAEWGLEAGQTDISLARSRLLPRLDASVDYVRLNDDRTEVIGGLVAERSSAAAITLTQLIYSDAVHANVEIQRYLQENREALKHQLELDIIQEAVTTYLDLLKAENFVRISREDVSLSRANLERARDRLQIGTANAAEVYRWQSRLSTSRQALLGAKAQLRQARDAVNRLLNRPLKEPFIPEPATIEDPSLIVSRKELFEYVSNDRAFELMGEFMVKEGLAASPELAALEALLAATQRQIEANRRAYWLPTITLQGEVGQVVDERRFAGPSAEDRTDWSVILDMSLPLFEGGARRARLSSSRLTLSQQLTQRDAGTARIEQRIRAALHQIGASYPSIQLSKDAATSAINNLNLVTDSYSRGAVSILDVLDAQNAALIAEEAASNAVFDFLIDLMNLQRNLGRFDFFLDEQGMDDWLERLRDYITAG